MKPLFVKNKYKIIHLHSMPKKEMTYEKAREMMANWEIVPKGKKPKRRIS